MEKLYTLLISIAFLISCTENHDFETTQLNNNTVNGADDMSAGNTTLNFYKWYRDNQNIQTRLVNNACDDTFDSTRFYSVDFKATEKYLTALKNSGFISDKYILDWRDYFKECDKNFKKSPINEGPPEGFDYDFVMNSQDFETELNTVEKAKISEIMGAKEKNTVTVQFLTGTIRTFELSLVDNKWYIDKIK